MATTFDFVLKIITESDNFTLEMMTINPSPKPGLSTPPRHYRILPDYGTDFLWPAVEDIREDEQGYRRGRGRTRLVPVLSAGDV